MMNMFKAALAVVLLSATTFAADFNKTISGLEKKDGLITTYVDHAKAKVYLALDKPDMKTGVVGRYIYATYLTAGLGSNPVGLDRSVPSGGKLLRFEQIGDKVAAFIENTRYRATADNPLEKKAVETSFATSMIWSTPIVATDTATGHLLIDITSFLLRDDVGVSARLKKVDQGSFKLAKDRSFVKTREAHAFPINLEFDAWQTFTSSKPGKEVRTTTPVPNSVTLIAHTTLLKLPDDKYKTRISDERASTISMNYVDMSSSLAGDTVTHLARRFRLQKDASGKVIKPIVFYVDNGAPEPIRSALVEGANWWATAFDKAGFKGGFRAEVLPEGVHPLDARYNVINWVHRATRGWSYGASVTDPRTGEVLRGVVLLGSLRVRQDIKIFEGLGGAAKTGTGDKNDPVELALQRIRQLAAHEVGHPLGFAHNMAASTYGGRASVMDYPAPHVTLDDTQEMDFSDVYGVGMGSWDDWAVNFLYGEYADGVSDTAAQNALLTAADVAGLRYVTDGHSRSISNAHIYGSVWDNGTNAIDSLINQMAVRRKALSRFGAYNLRKDESYEALQTKIVPVYLYHRYQLAAAAKWLGGMDFRYRHQGDGRTGPADVAWTDQERALEEMLKTISVVELDLSDDALMILSPSGFANGDSQFTREKFSGETGPMFDHMKAVSVAADMGLRAILHPARLNRLVQQSVRVDGHIGASGVISRVVGAVTDGGYKAKGRALMIQQVVSEQLIARLSGLVYNNDVVTQARGAARNGLSQLRRKLSSVRGQGKAHALQLIARLDDTLAKAKTPAVKMPSAPKTPPGSPIGATTEQCWHCDTADMMGNN